MARAASFDPSERLPWLSDPEPRPAPPRTVRSRVGLVLIAAAAGAAGAAGWTVLQGALAPERQTQPSSAETVRLPPPVAARPVEAQPAVSEDQALGPPPAPLTSVTAPSATPAPRIATATPPAKARASAAARPPRATAPKTAPARAATKPSARQPTAPGPAAAAGPRYDARAWNSGVAGRIIQLGAYNSPAQANREWNRVYYRYPLLRPLSPRVVRTNIRGRTYYRLQLGTFSHAHSEMLCQRLRAIREGCIVIGLNRQRTAR